MITPIYIDMNINMKALLDLCAPTTLDFLFYNYYSFCLRRFIAFLTKTMITTFLVNVKENE